MKKKILLAIAIIICAITPAVASLSSASYDSKTYDVVGETGIGGSGYSIYINGSSLFSVSDNDDAIIKFSWTPGDVSTASYGLDALSVSGLETGPTGVAFNVLNGKNMYVLGYAHDTIYQYTLLAAWTLTGGTSASKSFSARTETGSFNARGLVIKPDGTKFYVSNVNGGVRKVFQYSMSTAYDISTGSYDTKSCDVASQTTNTFGFFIRPNGTKMFVAGDTPDKVFRYTLGTAWDISTCSYDTIEYSFSAETTNVQDGISFSPDMTKMYLFDLDSNFWQYSSGETLTDPAGPGTTYSSAAVGNFF